MSRRPDIPPGVRTFALPLRSECLRSYDEDTDDVARGTPRHTAMTCNDEGASYKGSAMPKVDFHRIRLASYGLGVGSPDRNSACF